MDTRMLPNTDERDIVYIRAVKRSDLPPDVTVPPGHDTFYAIHDANGVRLALTDSRNLAFQMARNHDRTPVSVH